MKHLEKIDDFPPKTQAFLRENGFTSLDQMTPMERSFILLAASHEVVLPEGSVWLVLCGWYYEGEDVKACVRTKEEAEALAEKYRNPDEFGFDKVNVIEWKIGEVTDKRWERSPQERS